VWVVYWPKLVLPWLGITHGMSAHTFLLLHLRNEERGKDEMRSKANKSYTTYVINDASATYSNAYFELNYINVFSSSSSASASTTASSSRSSATGATTTISTGPGSTTTAAVRAGNGAGSRIGSAGGLVVVALVGSLMFL